MKFADKLSYLMDLRGMSQTKLAKRLDMPGLTQVGISELARGDKRPYMDQAQALAKALGVTLDYLADDELDEPPPGLSADEIIVLSAYRTQRQIEGHNVLTADEASLRLRIKSGVSTIGVPTIDIDQSKRRKL